MESNHCICINYILQQFVNAMRTIGQTQLSMMRNRDLPATDEGYITSIPNIQTNTTSWLSLDNTVIMVMLLGCILGYLVTSGRKKTQSKLN
jgi:hypothetical protein